MPTKIFLHAWLDFQRLFWLKFPKIATNSPTTPILFFLQPLKIPLNSLESLDLSPYLIHIFTFSKFYSIFFQNSKKLC